MKELFSNDSYQVHIPYPIDSIGKRSIYLLYQPLIGSQATGLYFTLLAEEKQLSLTNSPCSHLRLTKITGYSLENIQTSLRKLEGIGLVKTYCKEEQEIQYIYELQLPLTPIKFFNHQILNTLLLKTLGKEDYQRTKVCFSRKHSDRTTYQEVTAKFSEVFDIDLLQKTKPLRTNDEYSGQESNALEKEYKMELFYEGLKDYQIKKDSITSLDETIIQQLGILYKINVLDMQGIVKQCIHDDRLDHAMLSKECREYYDLKMPSSFQEVHHRQSMQHKSVVGSSSMDEHIKYLESITPYKLLQDKQGGKVPVKKDLMVIESIMTTLGLEPGVVNALIEFTLSQCDQTLPRGYMEYHGAKWRRKNIETVKQAIEEAKQTLASMKVNEPTWVANAKAKEIFSKEEEEEYSEEDIQAILAKYD